MRKAMRILLPAAAVLLLIGLIGTGQIRVSGATPSLPEKILACSACHSMEQEVRNWEQSPHQAVSCLQCHTEADVSWVRHELDERNPAMAAHEAGDTLHTVPLKAPNERCLECHEPQMEDLLADITPQPLQKRPPGGGEPGQPMTTRAMHDLHINGDPGLECLDCHFSSAHGGAPGTPERRNEMHQLCQDCHDQEAVVLAVSGDISCAACHTDPATVAPADHRDPNRWRKEHGKASRDGSCGQCHLSESAGPHGPLARPESFKAAQADACLTCHGGVPMPHGSGFLAEHGRVALSAQPGSCETCHASGERQCLTCHAGVSMPHGPDYLAQHGRAALNAQPGTCETCHTAEKRSCQACHAGLPMPHGPDFLAEHGKVALSAGSGACDACHTPEGNPIKPTPEHASPQFCSDCHLEPMPHPDEYLTAHGGKALQSPAVCEACHSAQNPVNPTAPHASADFCSRCHAAYQHPEGWVSHHGSRVDESCSACHTIQGEPGQHNACSTCHTGEGRWHPKMWFVSHARVVEKQGKADCLRCHAEVEPSCTKCHENP